MVAEMVPERGFRGPGCTDACEVVKAIVPGRFGRSELMLHDPSVHERYGQLQAGAAGGEIIRTGPLAIDLWRRMAWVGERDLALTGRDWELIEYLAQRSGRFCPGREIAGAIWGEWSSTHILHVFVTRLRARLGPAARLIETRIGHGYRLRMEPPERGPIVFVARQPWARGYAFCACCGTTERPHVSHGRCDRCRTKPKHGQIHYGPCGAPPAGSDGAP